MKLIKLLSLLVISLFLILGYVTGVNSLSGDGVYVHIDDHDIIELRPTGGHEWYMEARIYYSGFPMNEPDMMRYWLNKRDGQGYSGPYNAYEENYTYIDSYHGSVEVRGDGHEGETYDFKYQMKLNGLWSNYYIITVHWGEEAE